EISLVSGQVDGAITKDALYQHPEEWIDNEQRKAGDCRDDGKAQNGIDPDEAETVAPGAAGGRDDGGQRCTVVGFHPSSAFPRYRDGYFGCGATSVWKRS